MSKFLKACHVISRIFLYISLICVILFYVFRPELLVIAQGIAPGKEAGVWLAITTAVAISAVMFSAAELAFKSLTDNDFMITLSSSILEPAYGHFDISDKRYSKTSKGEFAFTQKLRDITDEKERVMYELAWEKQNNKRLQKKTAWNKIVMLVFFIAGFLFILFPAVYRLLIKEPMILDQGAIGRYFPFVALLLTVMIVLEVGDNRGLSRRLDTILSLRSRSDELYERPALPASNPVVTVNPTQAAAPIPAADPVPVAYPVPAEPSSSAEEKKSKKKKREHRKENGETVAVEAEAVEQETESVPEQVVSAPASVSVSDPEPVTPEENWTPEEAAWSGVPEPEWTPEPAWTGVPESSDAGEQPESSTFVNLTPDEGASAED